MTPGEEAFEWVKNKKNLQSLFEKFAGLEEYPPTSNPVTLFTAGATGVGKTEFAKTLAKNMRNYDPPYYIVKIDADEIRLLFEGYDGKNTDEFKLATARAVDQLTYWVNKNGQDAIIDGTMANYDTACRNIELALKKGRGVGIFYIYQQPKLAWHFAQVRKQEAGREVPKDTFINSYIESAKTVNKIKKVFGPRVKLNIIEKAEYNDIKKHYFNVDNIESHVRIIKSKEELEANL